MSNINLELNDNKLILLKKVVVTSGTLGVDSIVCTLDSTWDKFTSDFYFTFDCVEDGFSGKSEMIRKDNMVSCSIPLKMTEKPSQWLVGISAEKDGELIKNSTVVKIGVIQGASNNAEIIQSEDDIKNFFIELLKPWFDISGLTKNEIVKVIQEGMEKIEADSQNFKIFANDIYNLIVAYINSAQEEFTDPNEIITKYPQIIINYIINTSAKIEEDSEELTDFLVFKEAIYNLIVEYINPEDFDTHTDKIMYSFYIIDYIEKLKKENEVVITSLKNLYMGGADNA